jgi:hypothetical protein
MEDFMKYCLLALISLFLVTLVYCNTIVVDINGAGNYTSIQTAIDNAVSGDTIQVFPGRYYESLTIENQGLTLQSNYPLTGDRRTINNTIIDGQLLDRCVKISSSNVTLNGFTITNGFCEYGGGGVGLSLYCVEIRILNNIIENNYANQGGGIAAYEECEIFLSGNVIKDNRSIGIGGGCCFNSSPRDNLPIITFDDENLNSIFNNSGKIHDIFMQNINCEYIYLDTLSAPIDEPDNFFISSYSQISLDSPTNFPGISYLNYAIEQVDADIYVSPEGDDSNSGLGEDQALKSINYATKLVKANSVNRRSVYLLPGVYSTDLNEQFFPVNIQPYTKLLGLGENPEEVVIGNEANLISINLFASQTEIGNFTITGNAGKESLIKCYSSLRDLANESYYIHDIIIRDIDEGEFEISLLYAKNVLLENIAIQNCEKTSEAFNGYTLYGYFTSAGINNLTVNDVNIYTTETVGSVVFDHSELEANNLVFYRNYHEDYRLLSYRNMSEFLSVDTDTLKVNISNLLAYYNYTNAPSLVSIGNTYQPINISNFTIAKNSANCPALTIYGQANIRNSLFYQLNQEYQLVAGYSSIYDYYSALDIDYSLVKGGEGAIKDYGLDQINITYGDHNINTDPLFRGDVEGGLELGDLAWLQLSQESPCIDAGTLEGVTDYLDDTDIIGNDRIYGETIDMGAYEYNPHVNNNFSEDVIGVDNRIVVNQYPNPVSTSKTACSYIDFSVAGDIRKRGKIEIFNIKGQKIKEMKVSRNLSDKLKSQNRSNYSKMWDLKNSNNKRVSSGVYFYKISIDEVNHTGKMLILK